MFAHPGLVVGVGRTYLNEAVTVQLVLNFRPFFLEPSRVQQLLIPPVSFPYGTTAASLAVPLLLGGVGAGCCPGGTWAGSSTGSGSGGGSGTSPGNPSMSCTCAGLNPDSTGP